MRDLKRRLLKAYKQMYKENPKEYKGAMKISIQIGLSEKEHGSHYCKTHGILEELQKDGYWEQDFGFGFRYKKAMPAHQ